MTQKFQRKKEDFACENCGVKVLGNGFTNHCPSCLWSKHVDVFPGDRDADCGGLMEPIGIELEKGKYIVTQRCLKCGKIWRNEASPQDAISQFLTDLL
ncbi:MAG TPA: RNHCP domain-containing protein [Candidatus Paceibacterota bacterium]|nr:RNHCP domain-containing protein [Candidatus Paceibacterota bacterium]